VTAEPEAIQISVAALSEARWKSGDLYIYRHVCRCPGCDTRWTFEVAAPRGAIDPTIEPARIGPGLLCGTCAARRTAYAVFPRDGQGAGLMRFWGDQDEANVWGRCKGYHRAQYATQITRLGLWDLFLIHISEPTRTGMNSYAIFCLKKKKQI